MIVVGVDGSQPARAAVEWAVDDALRMREPLRIVHAVDRSPYQIAKFPAADWPDALVRAGEQILAEALAVARDRQPTVDVTTELGNGTAAVVLTGLDEQATEIVIGSRGHGGFAGALLGSVSDHVAGRARCPVVVVRGAPDQVRGQVVVGVDDTPEGEAALRHAFEQAAMRGATLRAVHAWQLPVHAFAPELAYDMDDVRTTQYQIIRSALERFEKEYPQVTVVEDVRSGHPVEALTEASAEADLVVVGSHGRGALGAVLLGSVSRGVLHHAHCPVAVVRTRPGNPPQPRT
ncbi:universal stress protein [Nonomuraea indica]|uniref:universal stress protein n=1 Tax=Nonomuraea indica TaxID=1581193 RepID=UPI000C7D1E0F|nr:universal stress protein [Nonomuraea indica]